MAKKETFHCYDCSETKLNAWKGFPYKDKMRCLKCQQAATISERRISDQKTEVKYNCEACDEVLP